MYMKHHHDDSEPKLQKVMDFGGCKKHNAPQGVPCFHIPKSIGSGYFAGVCGRRAKTAGFNAPISDKSVWKGKYGRGKH